MTTTFTIESFVIRDHKGFFGGHKAIVGFRIVTYTQTGEQARRQAYEQ